MFILRSFAKILENQRTVWYIVESYLFQLVNRREIVVFFFKILRAGNFNKILCHFVFSTPNDVIWSSSTHWCNLIQVTEGFAPESNYIKERYDMVNLVNYIRCSFMVIRTFVLNYLILFTAKGKCTTLSIRKQLWHIY